MGGEYCAASYYYSGKTCKNLDGSAGISEVSEEKSSAADDQSTLNMIMKISTSTRYQKCFKLISWS